MTSIPPERWLPVPGWEGLYEVSDLGGVRSLPHMTAAGPRGGRVLKPSPTPDGHLNVQLYRDGVRTTRLAHQLVLEAFLGPCPDGQESLHGRGGAQDNRLSNLRYGTHIENCLDRVRDGTDTRGERHGMAKLDWATVTEIRNRYEAGGATHRSLARDYKVSTQTVWGIVTGRTWQHVA